MLNWRLFFDQTDFQVLLYLREHDNERYSDLLRATGKTRGALATSLRDLAKLKLIERRVEQSAPVQTRYRLTDKGCQMARLLCEMQDLI